MFLGVHKEQRKAKFFRVTEDASGLRYDLFSPVLFGRISTLMGPSPQGRAPSYLGSQNHEVIF